MLDNALDLGLSEAEFWDMTIAELNRFSQSKARVLKRQAQEQATFDYIQAQLIIRGISSVLGSGDELPSLEDVYSGLFKEEEIVKEREEKKQQLKMELSVLRFKQYANFHNRKYEEVAKN